MSISAGDVAKLRDMTGAGMMDAKKALQEVDGDLEKAVDVLRKNGALKMAKKAERATAEGRIHTYTHANGKLAVMVEVMCETDFVARNEAFVAFCQDLALHIAAAAPQFTTREQVAADLVEREKNVYREQLAAEGKPAEMIEKILEGKLGNYYADIVLMDQKFVKDDSLTIANLLEQQVAALGENIRIGRFVRLQLGV